MKIALFIVFFVFQFFQIFAQTVLFEKQLDIKSSVEIKSDNSLLFKIDSESLPIIHYPSNRISMLILNKKEFFVFEFNEDFKVERRFNFPRKGLTCRDLIGGSVTNDSYNIFFTNPLKDQVYIVEFNLNTKKNNDHFFYFNSRDEELIGSLYYKNKFFILSVLKNSSILNLYEFENWQNYKVNKLDFSGQKFNNSKNGYLSEVFKIGSLKTIESTIPNSLEITSNPNKMYFVGDKLYLTLDHLVSQTIVVEISLEDYSTKVRSFIHGMVPFVNLSEVRSNSYYHQGKLFQIKCSKNELYLSILDFFSGNLMKDYRVKASEEVLIKNNLITKEGGLSGVNQDNKSVIKKTKTFLNKISHGNVGISCVSNNEFLTLTIGGFEEIELYNGGRGMILSKNTTGPKTIPIHSYNYVLSGFAGYRGDTNKRSIYFKGLFDKNTFEHKKGALEPNPFDKIKHHLGPLDKKAFSQTIFKVDNYLVLGYYHKAEKKYYLRKFE